MKNLYKIQDELYIIDNNEKVTQNGIWAKCSFTGDILKNRNGQYAHKVILTTNNLLIKDGVQVIDDEFLEWFVKNPSCEEVEVKDVYKTFLEGDKRSVSNFRNRYKIIIPKEEPKQETLEDYYIGKTLKVKNKIPSRYYESILQESETIKIDKFIDGNVEGCRVAIGYKNGFEYLLFNTAYVDSYLQSAFELIDESIIPKQETFERAKSTLRKHLFDNKAKLAIDLEQMREWSNANKQETLEEACERIGEDLDYHEFDDTSFKLGVKWEQEQNEILLNEYHEYTVDCIEVDLKRPLPFKSWFKQNKKK